MSDQKFYISNVSFLAGEIRINKGDLIRRSGDQVSFAGGYRYKIPNLDEVISNGWLCEVSKTSELLSLLINNLFDRNSTEFVINGLDEIVLDITNLKAAIRERKT